MPSWPDSTIEDDACCIIREQTEVGWCSTPALLTDRRQHDLVPCLARAMLAASVSSLSALGLPGAAALLRLGLLQDGLIVLLIHGHRILRLHDAIDESVPTEHMPLLTVH